MEEQNTIPDGFQGWCCQSGGLNAKSCLTLATPWTVACQAPLSMVFPRQEYWSGLSCPPPWDRPNPGIQPVFLVAPALTGGFFTPQPLENSDFDPNF